MLDINKQEMKYSRQGEKVTIYNRDKNGNIIYDEVAGEKFRQSKERLRNF